MPSVSLALPSGASNDFSAIHRADSSNRSASGISKKGFLKLAAGSLALGLMGRSAQQWAGRQSMPAGLFDKGGAPASNDPLAADSSRALKFKTGLTGPNCRASAKNETVCLNMTQSLDSCWEDDFEFQGTSFFSRDAIKDLRSKKIVEFSASASTMVLGSLAAGIAVDATGPHKALYKLVTMVGSAAGAGGVIMSLATGSQLVRIGRTMSEIQSGDDGMCVYNVKDPSPPTNQNLT